MIFRIPIQNALLVLCLFVGTGLTLLKAQVSKDFDLNTSLSLKDGSQLLGQLIEEDNHSITMMLSTGDTLDIGFGYIKRYRTANERMRLFKKGKFQYKSGDYLNLSLGITSSPWTGGASHSHLAVARRFTEQSSLGFGLGLDTYQAGIAWDSYSYLAVYLYGRRYLNKNRTKRTKPYAAARLGYGFAENVVDVWLSQVGTYKGGLMVNPSIGLHFSSRSKLKMLLGWTWQIQYTSADYRTADWWRGGPRQVSEQIWFIRSGISLIFEYN